MPWRWVWVVLALNLLVAALGAWSLWSACGRESGLPPLPETTQRIQLWSEYMAGTSGEIRTP